MRDSKIRVGQIYNQWTVVEYNGKNKNGDRLWKCRCSCGSIGFVTSYKLTSGRSKRCVECGQPISIQIGHSPITNSRLYEIWKGLNFRCCNPKAAAYKNYGGRGIAVCKEWNKSYLRFEYWATSSGYESNLVIDRIDCNGDYCPENCRWVTKQESPQNRRDVIRITINGVTKILSQWARENNIKYYIAYARYKRGENILGV